MDAWASWAIAPKVWKGQTVLAPDPEARPDMGLVALRSTELPLTLHVPASSSERRARAGLRALERAYVHLRVSDWPLPAFDGGEGGSASIDVYEVPRARCAGFASCSGADGALYPSDFDAARSFAMIASDVSDAALEPCMQSALAQAGLRALDPAEAESWVRASAELSVWQLTGELGCEESLVRAQAAPQRGLLDHAPDSEATGTLLLAMLSERVAPMPLVHNLWETTRQRSQGLVPADRLRSSPDLWEVMRQMLEVQHVVLDDELLELGVARYFAGPAARRAQAPYRVLTALPSDAAVPLAHDVSLGVGSMHLRDHPALMMLGSAYVRVKLARAGAAPQRMQAWLRGELGPRWSLTAVRLDATGRELGRTSAPARNVPNAYVPLTLDPETDAVLWVVTQLPPQLPDADQRVESEHGYDLIVEGS